MSLFSERLKQLYQDSGYTIYQISKNAGIDRTTIQRSLTGERLPGLGFVDTMCDYMSVAPSEKKELLELYQIAKIGEKKYLSRKYIKNMLEQLARIHQYQQQSKNPIQIQYNAACADTQYSVCHGEFQVLGCIQSVLWKAKASLAPLSILMPFQFQKFFDQLKQLYLDTDGVWEIRHLLRFEKDSHSISKPSPNLNSLSNALPFSLSAKQGYQPYYLYSNTGFAEDVLLAMPYYFFTKEDLVLLSADFSSAIHFQVLEMIEVYQRHFENALAVSKPMTFPLVTGVDMIAAHIDVQTDVGSPSHVMEAQPCFAKYFTEAMIENHLRKEVPQREAFAAKLWKLYTTYQKDTKPFYSFFTTQGLMYFAQTGILVYLPTEFTIPFSPEERILLFNRLKADMSGDNIHFCAIDSDKFMFSPHISLQIYRNKSILFVLPSPSYIVASYTNEQSLGEAFYDFFESLPESDFIYSKENTIALVDECIGILEKLIMEQTPKDI